MNIRVVVTFLAVLFVSLAASPALAGARAGIVAAISPGEIGRETLASSACPVFSWSQSAAAAGYRIAIFAVSPSGDPELFLERQFEGAVGSWSPSREECLEPGQSYAWVVRAEPFGKEGVEGEVVWSMPRRFRVDAAPSAEELAAALEVVARWQESRANLGGAAATPGEIRQGALGTSATSAGAPKSGALQRAAGSASRIPELAEAPEGVGVVSAVRGEIVDLTGFTAGLHGLQRSTEGGAGVLGETLALTGNVKGVYGYTESTEGRGTIGVAAAESGATIGVGGLSVSPDGFGVLGRATAETGIATGVWAESYSVDGRGVTGLALATSGSAHGVLGQTASPGGGALVGVNLANGPDLILDGLAAGATMTVLREGSLERASGSAETFDVRNPGGGGMTLTVAGNAVWHAGNDGPGSGLDADTLDGTQASAFQARVNGICPLGQIDPGRQPRRQRRLLRGPGAAQDHDRRRSRQRRGPRLVDGSRRGRFPGDQLPRLDRQVPEGGEVQRPRLRGRR